ncbi:hypothetical protein [Streptomyces sp. NPDC093261]|uniref:hypothetical protein n=1 Tax=Streptomyces sp. NPDC093261 TaxID=3366037 RepID=UPI0037FF6F45
MVSNAFQQNVVQSHRQNSNCFHANGPLSTDSGITADRVQGHCATVDESFNEDTFTAGCRAGASF